MSLYFNSFDPINVILNLTTETGLAIRVMFERVVTPNDPIFMKYVPVSKVVLTKPISSLNKTLLDALNRKVEQTSLVREYCEGVQDHFDKLNSGQL